MSTPPTRRLATRRLATRRLATRRLVTRALHRVAPEADLAAVHDAAGLQAELDLDSLDFLNFVVALQELTGRAIPEQDYPQLASLGGCVTYLEREEQ